MPVEKKSVQEIKAELTKQDIMAEKFAATKKALQLLDLTKTESRSYTIFNKDKLRQYLKNPKTYELNIRNLARFLERYSMPLKRIIHHYSEMIDLNSCSVVPLLDLTKDNDEKKVLKNYYSTLKKVQQVDLQTEILKMIKVYWLEGASFGYIYDDDEYFFIHMLDGDYCRISSVDGGVPRFAFNFSYFDTYKAELEYWDPEFKKKYDAYRKDTTALRWQELEYERQICFKHEMDDLKLTLPPFLSLFENLISLVDLQGIQSVKDALSIYKLIVAKMEVFDGGETDDFKVDIATALDYYEKLVENLPEEVAAVISPLPLDTIEFKGTTSDEENAISNAMDNLFKNSGGSQILNNDKTGSTIFGYQMISDQEMGIGSILPQIQKWMNKYLDFKVGVGHAFVKYMEVTPYTKSDKKKALMESGNNGVPVKLAIAALDGFTPLETLSLEFLENKCLKLHENWVPLSTSYTMSGDATATTTGKTSGGQTKDTGSLTDAGEASQDKESDTGI